MLKEAKTLGAATIIVGVVIVIALQTGATAQIFGPQAVDPAANTSQPIDDDVDSIPSNVTVDATTGNALRFHRDGVQANGSDTWTNGSWTTCVTATLGDTKDGTYDVVAYSDNTSKDRVRLQYDAGDWVIYYNNGSASATARVSARDATSAPVCATYDAGAGNVSITANETATSSLTTDRASRSLSWDWTGTIDEVRRWNSSLNSSQIAAYRADPIDPLASASDSRVDRWMLDEGEGKTTTPYYASGSASVGSATWTTGVTRPTVSETGYNLSANPFAINVSTGSYLDGAPVAYVSYERELNVEYSGLFDQMATALGLLVVGVLVIAARALTDSNGF